MLAEKSIRQTPVKVFYLILTLILCIQFSLDTVPVFSLLLIPIYLLISFYLNIAAHSVVKNRNYFSLFDFPVFMQLNISASAERNHQVKVVLIEEFLWRFIPVMLVKYYSNDWHGIAILVFVTLCFTGVHFYKSTTVYLILLAEFLFYFLLVTIAYYYYTDFLMPFIFHMVRNQVIFFIGKGITKTDCKLP